ncbi:MAG: hypothetical protein FWD76_01885 [Firmicutes bacterium]|nr:hypothetical protein [Bacillota bacterium]
MEAIVVTQDGFNQVINTLTKKIPFFRPPKRTTEINGIPVILDEAYCAKHNCKVIWSNNYVGVEHVQ